MSQRSFSRAQQRRQAAAARREALRRRRAGLAAGAAIGATALLASSAHAATFTVNSTADTNGDDCTATCTLRDAVDLANANDEADTIIFASGATGVISLTQPLVLTAPEGVTVTGPGAATLTVDGGSSQILQVDAGPLELTGLTLTGGEGESGAGGAAIRSTGGAAVTLTDDTITDNHSTGAAGGAIFVNGDLTVTRSTLTGNVADSGYGGGAIATSGSGATTITDSTISNNDGKYGSGISHKATGTLTITGATTLDHNTAEKYGAAILSNAPTTITGATVSNNSAKYGGAVTTKAATTISGATLSDNVGTASGSKYSSGGAIHSFSTLTVTGSTFTGNAASGGGAISAASELNVTDTTLSGNHASARGGAIHASATFTIDGSQLTGNTARTGAAIVNDGDADSDAAGTITHSSFSENEASADGGAIFTSENRSLTIDGSTLSENTAGGRGGAIATGGPLTVTASALTGNTAVTGGALATDVGLTVPVAVNGTSISGNTATGSAGGVLVDSVGGAGSVTITRSTISGNQAGTDEQPGRGGGVQLTGGVAGLVRITESTISGNRAAVGAGVDAGDPAGEGTLTAAGGSVAIDNSTVAANVAATSGGGLRLETENGTASTGTIALNSTILADNTAAGTAQDLDRAPAPDGADPAAAVTGGVESRFSLIETPGAVPVLQFASKPSIVGTDPQLGELADNGGPTATQLPAGTSPVVDQGHAPADEETDQRGSARPVNTAVPNATGGDGTDIGAVELDKASVPVPATPPATATTPAPPATTPPPAPPVPAPVTPAAPQQFSATVAGSSLAAGARGTRRLVIANLPGVTCAVSSGRITACSLTLRSTAALRIAGSRTVLPKGTVLATGRTSAKGITRAVIVKVGLTKAGAAVLATRPLGVPAAAKISGVANTGPVAGQAVVRLLRSTSIRIPVPEHAAQLPATVVAQIDATAKVFRNARSVTCNAYTDPGARALSLTTAQATFACRRLRTEGLIARTTANGHSAGHPLAPGVSEARRAISRRIVLRFGL